MQATETKERPILFSAEMVRAILDGRKTQTRRVVTQRTSDIDPDLWKRLEWDDTKILGRFGPNFADDSLRQMGIANADYLHVAARPHPDDPQDDEGLWTRWRVCCRYTPGDQLYVREALEQEYTTADDDTPNGCLAVYRADGEVVHRDGRPAMYEWERETLPSIFCPRWASRIPLEVTDVRVERVRDISDADARAEGVERNVDDGVTYYGPLDKGHADPRVAFRWLRDSINASRSGCSWACNPWVWAVSFKVIEGAR
jgi:hypothetical protein